MKFIAEWQSYPHNHSNGSKLMVLMHCWKILLILLLDGFTRKSLRKLGVPKVVSKTQYSPLCTSHVTISKWRVLGFTCHFTRPILATLQKVTWYVQSGEYCYNAVSPKGTCSVNAYCQFSQQSCTNFMQIYFYSLISTHFCFMTYNKANYSDSCL